MSHVRLSHSRHQNVRIRSEGRFCTGIVGSSLRNAAYTGLCGESGVGTDQGWMTDLSHTGAGAGRGLGLARLQHLLVRVRSRAGSRPGMETWGTPLLDHSSHWEAQELGLGQASPSKATTPAGMHEDQVHGRVGGLTGSGCSMHWFMRNMGLGGTDQAAATISMCIGWCRCQTKSNPALAGTQSDITPSGVY